jgi:hypothetical protein
MKLKARILQSMMRWELKTLTMRRITKLFLRLVRRAEKLRTMTQRLRLKKKILGDLNMSFQKLK